MEPDQYSGQKIFYGETLITNKADRENTERNNSFIYNPDKSDCYDCPLEEEEEFDPYYH